MDSIKRALIIAAALALLAPAAAYGQTEFLYGGCRIANSTRTWQAAEDTDVTGWDRDDDFIVTLHIATGTSAGFSSTVQIRWRDVTDAGSMAALSSTGELTWGGTTDLENGTAVAVGERGCSTYGGGYAWVDGTEREGANDAASNLPTKKDEMENQWAIDASGADYSHEYEFEVYDYTEAQVIGTCAATITMAAEPSVGFRHSITADGLGRGIGVGAR